MIIIIIFAAVNLTFITGDNDVGRPYRVEVARLARAIEENGLDKDSLTDCEYVTDITEYGGDFYNSESDYIIQDIDGRLYRFDYNADKGVDRIRFMIIVNIFIGIMAAVIIAVMIYMKSRIIKPFEQLENIPYELSKGNLTVPIKETKSRFFGRFIWGVDVLRENIEKQKERELGLQRDKKVLLLSLSHDIKTPLSAIKLYAKALSKGLYEDKEKQIEIADSINEKADEIEDYVLRIVAASKEDFLSFDVNNGEFYLSELIKNVESYYKEKLTIIKTDFTISDYTDCMLNGDLDRSIEVMQNIIENAIKYGDGGYIAIDFSEEDGCILITVKNSGCTLKDNSLPYIFNSFYRGENVKNEKGSGLGLYICRQLMHKMNGEIFAQIKEDFMLVTAVFVKA